jgi:sugar lactone lactonase YvrE
MKKNIYKILTIIFTLLLTTDANAQRIITCFAGNDTLGYSGDGLLATAAEENQPASLARDAAGNIYIGEGNGCVIRKVNITTGIITTIAGLGGSSNCGYSGDGIPATAAKISAVEGMAFDASGNLFFADFSNNRIRKIDMTTGIISTAVGTGASGFSGDGGPATAAMLQLPRDVKFDHSGNMYICDWTNYRIRKVNTHDTISTITGNGTSGYTGDGGPATAATNHLPYNIAFDTADNLFFIDNGNNCVRKINTHDTISTVVGTGTSGFSGDGGPATTAMLNSPTALIFDIIGDLYIADRGNHRIREVYTSGIIDTVVGNGAAVDSGDGGPALAAAIWAPFNLCFDVANNLYIADANANDVRKVTHDPALFSLGVKQYTRASNIVLSPNPNKGIFNIKGTWNAVTDESVSLTVTNVIGQIVYRTAAVARNGDIDAQITLNSDMPRGMYLLQIRSATQTKVIRFVVNN